MKIGLFPLLSLQLLLFSPASLQAQTPAKEQTKTQTLGQPQIQGQTQSQSDAERLDQVMQAANTTGLFNGVALIARHDSILLAKGYGWRDYEHRIKHDTNSVFLIGSITKQFTATIILWLQERHLLNATDKLSKYFPQYRYADRITIRNLLTHTSGIHDYTDQYFWDHMADKPFTQTDFWNIIIDQPLLFEPDSEFGYSNSNYTLLGYIIEKVSGKSYERMVRELIFDKAGMTHSGFDFTHLTDPAKSIGYEDLEEHIPIRSRICDSSATFAAAAIYTTAGDLYRWDKALYGNKIISQASLEEAFTPNKASYGYGWLIDSVAGKRFMSHNGSTWGFQSMFKRFPPDSACIILLHNEGKPTFSEFSTSLNRILFHDYNYYIPRKAIALSPDSLQQYTGQFQLYDKPEFKAVITYKEGRLLVTWTNMHPEEIFAEKKDFFHFKIYNLQLVFDRDINGEIAGFTAYNNDRSYMYTRINPTQRRP